QVEQLLEYGILGEIALNEVDVVQRVHRQNVGGHDSPFFANQLAGHLRPATGGRAQIHEQHAGSDQLVLLVQLNQLVAGPGTQAILLRAFDVGIVDVFVQPATAAFGSFHERANYGNSIGEAAPFRRQRGAVGSKVTAIISR